MRDRVRRTTIIISLGVAVMVNIVSSPLRAETGGGYPSVNGTTITCPPPHTPSAEQQAAQFDTRPKNLDELSRGAGAGGKDMPSDPAFAKFLKAQAEQRAVDWPYLCRYRDANAKLQASGKRPNVVFMGDSITEGWILANPAFFEANGYVDRGISGQSSTQMLARFYADVVKLRPTMVHIMAGTNDIGGATGPMTEEDSVNNIRAMIDMAQANGIRVVLASIPPMSRLIPRPDFNVRPMVRLLNERFRAVAAERGVPFIDYFTPLADGMEAFDPRFANDGVHPTRVGYKIMEPLAQRAIAQAQK